MVLDKIKKSKFAQINDKKCYFSNGILSLPFSRQLLHEIIQFKKEENKQLNCADNKELYIERFLTMSENFLFDATFPDNILVVGKTACGKTGFVQSPGKNKRFGDGLKSVDWVSKTNLTQTREKEIRECFNYKTIEFHYLDDLGDYDTLLETFKRDSINSEKQEKSDNCNNFIVMGDVSGLADKSNNFSNFLTVESLATFVCT